MCLLALSSHQNVHRRAPTQCRRRFRVFIFLGAAVHDSTDAIDVRTGTALRISFLAFLSSPSPLALPWFPVSFVASLCHLGCLLRDEHVLCLAPLYHVKIPSCAMADSDAHQ